MFRRLLDVQMSKKCTPLWCEAHFEVTMLKTPHVPTTFVRSDVVSRGRRKGLCTLSKVSKTWGFRSISKNGGTCGAFEEDLQRCNFRGRRSTRDLFIRDVRRSRCWFPERGCILEHQICRFAKMILCDRYDLASLFRGRHSTLDRWKNRKTHGYEAVSSAVNFQFLKKVFAEVLHFWRSKFRKMRKSRRLASFLTCVSTWKIDEVSLRFWFCQVREMASFSGLQIDRLHLHYSTTTTYYKYKWCKWMTSICGVRYILKSCPSVIAKGLDWTCVMVLTLHFQKRINPSSRHSLQLSPSHCHVACAVMAHHMKAQLNCCSAGDALSQRIEAVLGCCFFCKL